MATYRTTGVIIKRNDFGEADRILTIFTQYKGKISAIAKGVRKMESRKGGNVELFNHTAFQLAEGKSMEVVVEAEVIESFRYLREDLHLISLVYQLIELVDQFMPDGQTNANGFILLQNCLAALNQKPDEDTGRKIAIFFQIHFLTTVGYKPELNQCVKCGNKLVGDGNIFSPVLGGVVDQNCASTVATGSEISVEAIKTLRFFQTQSLDQALKLRVEALVQHEVEQLLHNYLEFILEKDLRAVAFTKKTRFQP